ncbi:MAG TPA: FAD-dependent oxidoreductase, partial [Bdellovibrio sp.]|nr:FAD-dependent oxidoreductase [Bdellovibrio sp.]
MARTHQNNLSLWQEDLVLPDTPTLAKSATTEVCIVGAGFSGLLTAYRLLKNSHKVIVIDRDGLGYGDSALSSAHLSDVLDDHFTEIIRKHGKEKARIAYESHRDAIDLIENIVRDEKIECDFVRLDGYLFLSPGQDPEFLETEMQAALDCGVENVKKIEQPEDVFFDAGLCLQFADQAQFHPVKFLNGLCERIRLMGGQIFTNTSAEVIEDGPQVRVRTANGCQITCQHAVVATNVPVNNIMSVHLKEAAFRSYVIGMKVPRGNLTPALFWDTGKPYHYIRLDMAPERDFDVLLVGGEDHRVGQENHPERIFQKLRDWVESRLGVVDPEVIYNWSGQIIEPMDGVAYIGKNPGAENVYVVTGDSGQGVTHAAIASHLLTALIQKEEHPWEKLYDPSRFNWRSLNEF